MITSRLTTKARTTIPTSVREALGLGVGDEIAYVIAGDQAVITRTEPGTAANPFASFHEWAGEADNRANGNL